LKVRDDAVISQQLSRLGHFLPLGGDRSHALPACQ